MNRYKKTFLIIGIAIALPATHAHGLSVNELKTFFDKEILSHAQNNLFAQRQDQIFNNLATASTIIKSYIIEEASNDSVLMRTLAELDQARMVLANSMKLGYNNFFAQPDKVEFDNEEKKIAIKITNNLKVVESDVPNIIKRLNSVLFFMPNKKRAREFLELFGRTITMIAKAAFEDFTIGLAKQLQMGQSAQPNTPPAKRVLQLRDPIDEFPGLRDKRSLRTGYLHILGLPEHTSDPIEIQNAYEKRAQAWNPKFTKEPDKEYAAKVLTLIDNAYHYLMPEAHNKKP